MKPRLNETDLEQFFKDVELLQQQGYQIQGIAQKMKNSNFSGYLNEHKPITKGFLRQFYKAFGEELAAIKKTAREANPTGQPGSIDPDIAAKLDNIESLIKSQIIANHHFNLRIERLEQTFAQMLDESTQKIIRIIKEKNT